MGTVTLASLWLPILLSAVAVFIASSICWMALPHHRKDWNKFKNDEAMQSALRAENASAGLYMLPGMTCGADRKDPTVLERWKRGPWATLIVYAGPPNMGRCLSLWFIHLVMVALFVAYVTCHALPVGAPYLEVFRIAGASALLATTIAEFQSHIWKGYPLGVTLRNMIDGVVYALLVGGVFGWLWPHGS